MAAVVMSVVTVVEDEWEKAKEEEEQKAGW